MCLLLRLVAEFDRRSGWADQGAISCAAWLSWRCSISPTTAREHVRVAQAPWSACRARPRSSRADGCRTPRCERSRVAGASAEHPCVAPRGRVADPAAPTSLPLLAMMRHDKRDRPVRVLETNLAAALTDRAPSVATSCAPETTEAARSPGSGSVLPDDPHLQGPAVLARPFNLGGTARHERSR